MNRFQRIVRVEQTGSTNDDVARILGEEQARGLVLVAGYQHSGSGRRGRAWVAPPGRALVCTLALPDAMETARLWCVPFWAALVTQTALRSLGLQTSLQWPNDVLADRRKAAGILCISRTAGDQAWAACGIGINVTRPDDETSYAALELPPAFVSDSAQVSVDDALAALVAAADSQYDLLRDPARIIEQWQSAANVPGARYRILPDNETQPFEAAALALLPDGSLLVDRAGERVTVSMADVRVLR